MVTTRKRVRKTALQLSVAAIAFASLGAAVAAPIVFSGKSEMMAQNLQPLAGGPTLQLAKAGPGLSEDCVRVTSMIGPDGKSYPTNGMVCSGD